MPAEEQNRMKRRAQEILLVNWTETSSSDARVELGDGNALALTCDTNVIDEDEKFVRQRFTVEEVAFVDQTFEAFVPREKRVILGNGADALDRVFMHRLPAVDLEEAIEMLEKRLTYVVSGRRHAAARRRDHHEVLRRRKKKIVVLREKARADLLSELLRLAAIAVFIARVSVTIEC